MDILGLKNSLLNIVSKDLYIYPESFRFLKSSAFFILKDSNIKYLAAAGPHKEICSYGFTGQSVRDVSLTSIMGYGIKLFERNGTNLNILLDIFPMLKPSPLKTDASFGFGGRLGVASAAHAKIAAMHKKILPVFSQQSVRELKKINRNFKEVISDSIWNIFQGGYQRKWGAYADHIKDIEDFKKATEAGMTMYTLDTSDYLGEGVISKTDELIRNENALESRYITSVKKRYQGKDIIIGDYRISFDEYTLKRLILVYGRTLRYIQDIFNFLKKKLKEFDYEISSDETNTVTTPEAHYFLANEMANNGVRYTSMALRFPGIFEKGIDYIGNIQEFENSINIHSLICRKIGGYKLSLHSGSDKFSIFPLFAKYTRGVFHIKTSGTSWLEALRVTASVDPEFFRDLYTISFNSFNDNKKILLKIKKLLKKVAVLLEKRVKIWKEKRVKRFLQEKIT